MNQNPIPAVPPPLVAPRRAVVGRIGILFGGIALGFTALMLIFKPG